MKKIVRTVLTFLLAILMLPVPADAAGPVSQDRPVQLTVMLRCGKKSLPGAQIRIYQICDMDASGKLTPLDAYGAYADTLDIRGENAARWQEAAGIIEEYIRSQKQIQPTDQALTDAEGKASFPSPDRELPHGLYLVESIRHRYEDHIYSASAFFVMLPSAASGDWDYSVSAEAKAEETEKVISLQVIKQWEDEYWESKRPSHIQVILYRDELPYETITLPHKGQWSYRWEALSAEHSWWVGEVPVEGYETEIYRNGNTFLIKNICKPTGPEDPTLPQTGQIWWPIPLLLMAGVLLILGGMKGTKENEAEE